MIVPVILSGGSGSRLWPLSREFFPKQFLSLINTSSLFQDTINRASGQLAAPLVICNEEHRFIVAEQLRQIDSLNNGIILEPVGKNTAPAIAIAAISLMKEQKDPILLVLSSDHVIENKVEFLNSIQTASKIAEQGKMVAIGVKPNKPEIGYGYIRAERSVNHNYFNIVSFTEKPDINKASEFLKSQDYYWNSGIFIFKASAYLDELKKYEPEIFSTCKKSIDNSSRDLDFIRLDNNEFFKCPSKSIDYAIMENTINGVVVPFEGSWSDIGSWSSLWELKKKDINNNVSEGDVLLNNVQNSYVHSSNRLVAVNQISDLIIIDTQDALLVSSKNNSQDIKDIFEKLKKDNRSEVSHHRKVLRPWGYFDSVDNGNGFQVKRILVNPGSKLSLQKHKMRSEHWIIVKGRALITCGNKVFYLDQNQSTYIPKEEVHRLENKEDIPLEIIEIQTGEYLGEDDIIRLDDDYDRS